MCMWDLNEEELLEAKLGKELGLQTITANLVKLYKAGVLKVYKTENGTLRHQMIHYPHYDDRVPPYCYKEVEALYKEKNNGS